jgi:hypothetical protein
MRGHQGRKGNLVKWWRRQAVKFWLQGSPAQHNGPFLPLYSPASHHFLPYLYTLTHTLLHPLTHPEDVGSWRTFIANLVIGKAPLPPPDR